MSALRNFLVKGKRWLRRNIAAAHMRKLDAHPVPEGPGEIRLFMALRDEELRVPFLLKYYFDLGVDRAFVIDHSSKDGTVPYLLRQPNTHVFRTGESFIQKVSWIDWVLHKYGAGHWCVIADCDEFFVYPHYEKMRLKELAAFLDAGGYTALHALLLDMYPGESWDRVQYRPGQHPVEVCPFFDADSHRQVPYAYPKSASESPFRFVGGVRHRVFGIGDFCLSKFPMFRFARNMFLIDGFHAIEGARIPDLYGAVLHFKFLQDFGEKTFMDAERYEWGAREYQAYAKGIQEKRVEMVCDKSVRFRDSAQFVDLKLMKSSPALDAWAARAAARPAQEG